MLRKNFVIWFNLCLWILGLTFMASLEGCLQSPDKEKDPLESLAGTYTAFEMTIECQPTSLYSEVQILPPILTSTLIINSNKSFTWQWTIIEDSEGIVPDCLGVTSASLSITGTISGDATNLIFDTSENGIEGYVYTMNNGVLSISSNDGEDSFKFNRR